MMKGRNYVLSQYIQARVFTDKKINDSLNFNLRMPFAAMISKMRFASVGFRCFSWSVFRFFIQGDCAICVLDEN